MAKEIKRKNRIGVSIQRGICYSFEGEGDPLQGTSREIKALNDTNAPIGSSYLDLLTGTMYVKMDTTPDAAGIYKVGGWISETDLTGQSLIGWQDFADSGTSEASPLVQPIVSGGDVHLTNNNNDTLTDGNTGVNAETTVVGVNDLWSTTSNTFVFKDTGIEKNDLLSIRVHLNVSASIISQDFSLRFDFYDDVDAGGNYIFSLNQHLATEALSAGVFRERIVAVDAFVGESILNGSAKCFLVGTKSFEVEVIGWNIRIFKIAR